MTMSMPGRILHLPSHPKSCSGPTRSGIKGLRLHDSRHVRGNRLPATIAFDEHIGGSVLAAGIFALVAALSRSEPVHHRRVAVNADLQFIQLERLELDGP